MEIERKFNIQAVVFLILLILASLMVAIIAMGSHGKNAFLYGLIAGPTILTASYPCIYLLVFHVFKASSAFHKEQGIYYAKWMVAFNLLFVFSVGSVLNGTIYWALLTMIFQILLCIYYRFKILNRVDNKHNQSFNLDGAKSAPPS